MHIFRSLHHAALAPACALTIGNFDGVHRGHQAMLALLRSEAQHRSVPSCVLTFEPHPRDFFAMRAGRPELAPTRIATLRDKLAELQRCGVDQVVVLRFDEAFARQTADHFIRQVLLKRLGARYVLVGDDFRFGAQRLGDYALLDTAGEALGFEVARMNSYEVHGLRVSSSAVRDALTRGDSMQAAQMLGHPYTISGHVIHGQKLGRRLGESMPEAMDGFRTLNLRFPHARPAVQGIFIVHVWGLTGEQPLQGVASLGVRPTVEEAGRVLLEAHCFDWPKTLGLEGGYGKLVRVELLHRLRDEARYDTLEALTAAIHQDAADAHAWFSEVHAAPQSQILRDLP